MSILKSKHSGWTHELKRTPFMDGGGGGGGQQAAQPTTSTSYNTNVPEYARPYVENMLQSTQKQIYNDDMTSFRPYTPYSTDVNNYFADFSPTQKYAQSETANMQTPGEFGLAGAGSLLAGSQYSQNVTNPATMAAYMNPYQQGVTDVAKNAAVREAQMAENVNKLSSARQGTYGGARQTLGSIERERNLLSNLSNIQSQGSNQAYNQALQSQQFGANLGLQGYGQAAQIGSQRQAADLARLQAQQTVGAQQQTMEQNKINQGISNYATAQQYPFMQLGIMNSMLRGLPLQQTTTATYQQQPSTTQQLAGLAGAGLSYFGGGKKEGGVIEMKEGGTVPGFKYGDLISDPQLQGMSQGLSPQQLQGRIADPQVNNNERDIFQSTQQAQQRMASNPMAAQQMAQAAPPPQMAQAPSQDARMGGIAQAGGDMFNTMGYAGGGIIAFENGGDVGYEFGGGPSSDTEDQARRDRLQLEKNMQQYEFLKEASPVAAERFLAKNPELRPKVETKAVPKAEPKAVPKAEPKAEPKVAAKETPTTKETTPPKEATPTGREAYLAQTQAMMEKQGFKSGATEEEKAYADMVAKQQAGLGDATSAKERANMAKAFLKMGANPRGFLAGAIEGGESYLTGAGEIAAGKEAREATLAEARAKYSAAQRARAAGDIAASDKLFSDAAKLEQEANIAKNRDATSITTAGMQAASAGATQRYEEDQIKRIQQEYKAKTGKDLSYEEAIKRRTEAKTTAADSIEGQNKRAAQTALQEWKKSVMYTEEYLKMTPAEKLEAENKEYQKILGRFSGSGSASTAAASASPQTGAPITVSTKAEYDKLKPGQTYFDPNGQLRTKG